MAVKRTVVISCAGMGNRLGMGVTKALLEVEGKPLIVRLLEMLEDERNIRVVVGYQAEKVIEVVQKCRNDISFVFNHRYKETGTGVSVALAVENAEELILAVDGDLLIHPDDMKKILACQHEFVGGGIPVTDDPWMLQTYEERGRKYVSEFSKSKGNYEWNGVMQMESRKILHGEEYVFQLLEPHLPLPFMELRTREIDTVNDYKRAIEWVKNGFC